MEASKAVLLLMVILGSLMIPAYSRNVVRFCKCEKQACKKGAISEGSVFGKKEGVFHHRTTILIAEEYFPTIISSFKKFNDSFMEQYEGYSRMWCEHEK
uniref:Uncharacterized protein n=1 Tax=Zea mays TaxID=4577 RepID=A0A804N4R1_MAIZE